MKLLAKTDSSHYPGVTIYAEQSDMILLGERLKAGAELKSIGIVPIDDMQVGGEPFEYINFEIVKSYQDTLSKLKVNPRPFYIIVGILFFLFLALCFLAYIGLESLL